MEGSHIDMIIDQMVTLSIKLINCWQTYIKKMQEMQTHQENTKKNTQGFWTITITATPTILVKNTKRKWFKTYTFAQFILKVMFESQRVASKYSLKTFTRPKIFICEDLSNCLYEFWGFRKFSTLCINYQIKLVKPYRSHILG